jgi:hypothetical protein
MTIIVALLFFGLLDKSNGLLRRRKKEMPASSWLAVISAPDNVDKRHAIRHTWKRDPWVQQSTFHFVVGRSKNLSVAAAVSNESNEFGDILHVDVDEAYRNLTLKTLATLKEGVKTDAAWILKIDDDVVPRIPLVIETLLDAEKKSCSNCTFRYVGKFDLAPGYPIRNIFSKYYVSFMMYPEDNYPKYAGGPLYALSHDLASHIVSEERNKRTIPMEDTQVGIAVEAIDKEQKLANKEPVQYVEFHPFASHHVQCTSCHPKKLSTFYCSVPPAKMSCMWKKVQNGDTDACC